MSVCRDVCKSRPTKINSSYFGDAHKNVDLAIFHGDEYSLNNTSLPGE